MKKFCNENAKYWSKVTHNKGAGVILVEGFFGEAGPNYVIRVGTIAKALEEKYKMTPIVLLERGVQMEPSKKEVWSSFSIDNFIGVMEDIAPKVPLLDKLKVKLLSRLYFLVAKILIELSLSFKKLSYKGIQIGDLIYDQLVKINREGSYTITYLSKADFGQFFEAFKGILYADWLCKNYDIKYYVATHSQYTYYGAPARYLKSKGVVVIETTDDGLFVYDDKNHKDLPVYHDFLREEISKLVKKVNKEESIKKAEEAFANRFLINNSSSIDVELACKGKKLYDKDSLRLRLNIENTDPFVFIFSHVFSDAPQGLVTTNLFSDYFQWLDRTIRYCSSLDNHVNWIVKEHPSVDAYGERGEVKKLVQRYCGEKSNVYMCPDDFNTAGIKNTASIILTNLGTVGLEAACLGIPVIITGQAFYSGAGFTIEPKSKQEYYESLANAHTLMRPLSDEQKNHALLIFQAFFLISNGYCSKLIDSEIKNLVWGTANVKQDISKAFDLMGDRLKSTDPRKLELFQKILRDV